MDKQHAPKPIPILFTILVAAVPLVGSGCSEELAECVREWTDCTEECSTEEEEQAAVAQAEAEYRTCVERCPHSNPPTQAELACVERCLETRQSAIEAATHCRTTCEDAYSECFGDLTTCDDVPDTTHLTPVRPADWTPHMSRALADDNHTVLMCLDHFAPGSASGVEAETSLAAYNDVHGSALHFTAAWQPHVDKSQMFAEPVAFSSLDYVDNANDSFPHACHPDNATACGDDPANNINGFTLNSCKYATDEQWKGTGDTKYFALSVNANCYGHFLDPASTDYPMASGIEHELGHATGMNHTQSWPVADQQYIGTMQGNLTYLSAYDVAFLRNFYPDLDNVLWRNFVASSKIRLDFGGPGEVNGTFEQTNPARVYLVGDELHDCATQQPATFYSAWFNTGDADQLAEHCMVNELRIDDATSVREVVLRRWHAAPMPAESQDHWTGPALVEAADLAALPLATTHELVFEVNVYEQWREDARDNQVRAPIRVYGSPACADPVPMPALPPPPVQVVAPRLYQIDRGFANRLASDRPRILRDTRLLPVQLPSGKVGLRVHELAPGSLLSALGGEVGDVLVRIGGQFVTAPGALAAAAQRLWAGETVETSLLRAGKPLQLSHRLRP